ncbi:hypothetical protein HPB52_001964 [Rhipicephalus sanguineus]|uniref:Monocarboxylate transporter n=1 Tax=Rhipicephalus sanguineus TaxID=34632 RepID=A0A9D4PTT7_RHISA|nr:hypothetical protein HPB52_001964 [Rhipicephalus sanguineus]
MVTDPAKKPYDRIREHLMSSRHKKFKTASKEAETAGTSQQTLFDMSCRQRAKETEADDVIHDFVRALAYSGISMHQADGPLGDFARKYCKAAKTMPTGQRLRLKYLKEAFDKDMEKIRDDMRDVKVSVIVDESPDITGVPTINTLLCYYSQKNVKKHVVLVDVDRVNASNSYTVASAVSKALLTVRKTWKDVVAVATDSAEYMRKMVREICQAEGIQILHVKDIAHLIHSTKTLITSFLAAIGSGMLFVVIPTVINEHFIRYKGLAMGINFAGATMGTFIFPKFLELTTSHYGFKSALLLFGALCLNAVAFSLFLRQPSWLKKKLKEQKEQQAQEEKLRRKADTTGHTANGCRIAIPNGSADGETNVNKREVVPGSFRHGLTVFSCPMFYVVVYSYIAFSFAFECYISLLVDFAIDRGISVSHAVTVLSTSSVADLVGRLTLPALADRGYFTRQALMTISFAWMGSLYLMLPLAESYAVVFAMATAIAFCIGTTVVLFSVLCAEYVGIERVSMAYGMVSASAGMTSLAKPLVIGYFRDKVGSYDNLFRLCGSTVTLGAIIWIFVHIRLWATSKHTWTLENGTLCGSHEDGGKKKSQL